MGAGNNTPTGSTVVYMENEIVAGGLAVLMRSHSEIKRNTDSGIFRMGSCSTTNTGGWETERAFCVFLLFIVYSSCECAKILCF